jgi:hypothetical protein
MASIRDVGAVSPQNTIVNIQKMRGDLPPGQLKPMYKRFRKIYRHFSGRFERV